MMFASSRVFKEPLANFLYSYILDILFIFSPLTGYGIDRCLLVSYGFPLSIFYDNATDSLSYINSRLEIYVLTDTR